MSIDLKLLEEIDAVELSPSTRAWREAVRTLAKKHIDKTFFVSKNMFIRCPNGYRVLCAQYKQRQRG